MWLFFTIAGMCFWVLNLLALKMFRFGAAQTASFLVASPYLRLGTASRKCA